MEEQRGSDAHTTQKKKEEEETTPPGGAAEFSVFIDSPSPDVKYFTERRECLNVIYKIELLSHVTMWPCDWSASGGGATSEGAGSGRCDGELETSADHGPKQQNPINRP